MGDVITYEEFRKFQKEKEEMKEIKEDLKEIRNLIYCINSSENYFKICD